MDRGMCRSSMNLEPRTFIGLELMSIHFGSGCGSVASKPASTDYLDTSHERYAPKLAAVVGAWLACGDPEALRGKHPKQAVMKWLRENAADFGLTDDDGNPQENTIDEIAKIANWKLTSGAPKTPGNG